MNMKAENKVLKKDLLEGDTSLIEAREDVKRLTESKTKLESQVMSLSAKGQEDEQKIEGLQQKVQDLTSSLLRRGVENTDLKAQLK